MLPKQHLLLGFIFSFLLYILFPEISPSGFLLIFLSSFLLDIDHYFYYVYKKNDLNLKRAYKWFVSISERFISLSKSKREKYYLSICFFHGIEIVILLFLLGFLVNPLFYSMTIGVTFHLLLDFISDYKKLGKFERFSVIYQVVLIHHKKNFGKDKYSFFSLSFPLLLGLVEQIAYSNKSQKISILNDFLNYKRWLVI